MEKKTVNILGTEYNLEFDFDSKEADGETRFYEKVIKIRPTANMLDEDAKKEAKKMREKEVMRHEVFHAILYEAGADEYSRDEKLIDILAILSPKIFKLFQELDIL